MDIRNIIKDYGKQIFIATIAGLSVTFILFIFNAYIHPPKNLTGAWTVYVKTEKTGYTAFKDLTCIFKFQIVQSDDNMLTGTGEKIYDINPNGTKTEYATVQRDRVSFQGKIEQTFFGGANVFLEMTEIGSKYTTTSNFKLVALDNATLAGTFNTTIANGSGHVKMKKD